MSSTARKLRDLHRHRTQEEHRKRMQVGGARQVGGAYREVGGARSVIDRVQFATHFLCMISSV